MFLGIFKTDIFIVFSFKGLLLNNTYIYMLYMGARGVGGVWSTDVGLLDEKDHKIDLIACEIVVLRQDIVNTSYTTSFGK